MCFWKLVKVRLIGDTNEEKTSFQKQERVFYVFGNSYFGSPIRNGLRPFLVGVETWNIFWGDYQLFDTNILCFDASNFSNLMVSIGS